MGRQWGSLNIRDGGVTVGFNILSNPGNHRILSLVSVAVLSPSRSGWPGSEPIIPQPFRLEQPTRPLSLLSTSLCCSPWGDFSVMPSFKVPHRPDVSSVPSWSSPAGPSCPIAPVYPSLPFALPPPCLSRCHRLARRVDSVKVTQKLESRPALP